MNILEKQLQASLNPKDATEIVNAWTKDIGMPPVDTAKYMKEFAEALLEMPDEKIKEVIGEYIDSDFRANFTVKRVGVRRFVNYWLEIADYYLREVAPANLLADGKGAKIGYGVDSIEFAGADEAPPKGTTGKWFEFTDSKKLYAPGMVCWEDNPKIKCQLVAWNGHKFMPAIWDGQKFVPKPAVE